MSATRSAPAPTQATFAPLEEAEPKLEAEPEAAAAEVSMDSMAWVMTEVPDVIAIIEPDVDMSWSWSWSWSWSVWSAWARASEKAAAAARRKCIIFGFFLVSIEWADAAVFILFRVSFSAVKAWPIGEVLVHLVGGF